MSAASTAATLAAAEAAALAGTTVAQLGYALTTKALDKSTAPAVFPLILLELASVAGSYATYAATDASAQLAELNAQASFSAATAYWSAYAA
jgi:hypothetical protein